MTDGTKQPQSEEPAAAAAASAITTTTTAPRLPSKKKGPKVMLNGLAYPAHPYTVRVLDLPATVQDMDLVDLLKPCGALVHARVVRDHQTQNSKGWGLVQFEDVASVAQALALSGQVGLHEKLVTIDRSHTAAVPLVPPPPGRYHRRVQDKRHDKKKRQRTHSGDGGTMEKEAIESEAIDRDAIDRDAIDRDATEREAIEKKAATTPAAPATQKASILSLAPRGVRRKGARPKPKIGGIPKL